VSDAAAAEHPTVDVIAIGASAGGLQPLREIVAALPRDFSAGVLVVVHVAATRTSVLPQILARTTKMEVVRAQDGVALAPGRLIVAPPDRHLVVKDGHIRLGRGQRENGHRPAIDPLLRSLARSYGPRCAGVILSGTRDDGTLGLAEIKRCGGMAIVQDPSEAEYPGMPANAMAATLVDGVLRAAAIAHVLIDLAAGHGRLLDPSHRGAAFAAPGESLAITCPDCGGVLTETHDAGVDHFRCPVGHVFSPRSLLAFQADGVERVMWTAARSLEDRAALLQRLADGARVAGNGRAAGRFEASARTARGEARAIRDAIAALDDVDTLDVDADPQEIVR
jgi:two-component system, chemotaxis family, protein-glutamate methylesterase/glutaminase